MHALYQDQVEGELYFLAAGFRRGAFCGRPTRGSDSCFWLGVSRLSERIVSISYGEYVFDFMCSKTLACEIHRAERHR
jgi:hypothetical protein